MFKYVRFYNSVILGVNYYSSLGLERILKDKYNANAQIFFEDDFFSLDLDVILKISNVFLMFEKDDFLFYKQLKILFKIRKTYPRLKIFIVTDEPVEKVNCNIRKIADFYINSSSLIEYSPVFCSCQTSKDECNVLSNSELEVFSFLTSGYDISTISRIMHFSNKTVYGYRLSIMRKFKISSNDFKRMIGGIIY